MPDIELDEIEDEWNNLSVPTDLLELHILLEESEVTPDEFKEAFGS